MQVANASTASGATVSVGAYSTTANCRWELTAVPVVPSGLYLYNTSTKSVVTSAIKYVAPEETRSLSQMSLVVVSYDGTDITQTVSWSTSNSLYASVNSAGSVTGRAFGTTTITARKYLSGSNRTVSFMLQTTEIANGTYFLKNKQTAKYVDIKDQAMSSGTQIHQWEFHGGASQKWTFTHLGDGYYSIKSANASTAYYLGVSGDSAEKDTPIVLRTGTLTEGMKWTVYKTASGAYKITPKTGVTNNCVLAVGWYAANTNGVNIEQRDYEADANYKDEWYILLPDRQFFQITAVGSNATEHNSIIQRYFEENAHAYGTATRSASKSKFMTELQTVRYFSATVHGGEFEDKLLMSTGEVLYLNEISSLPDNCLAHTDLIILCSCYSGRVDGFVDTLSSKGARIVIGFLDSVEDKTGTFWTERVVFYLSMGETVEDALTQADADLLEKFPDSYYREVVSLILTGRTIGNTNPLSRIYE